MSLYVSRQLQRGEVSEEWAGGKPEVHTRKVHAVCRNWPTRSNAASIEQKEQQSKHSSNERMGRVLHCYRCECF